MENETAESSASESPAPLAEVKRRRGRPPKFPRAEDAPSSAKPVASGDAPKKRGRPPKKSVEFSDAAKESLGKQLVGIHLVVAGATGMSELAISSEEGQLLAGGLIAVAQEYGLSLSGKTGAALQLFAAAAMVYMPRFVVINNRVKSAKTARANPVQDAAATTVN